MSNHEVVETPNWDTKERCSCGFESVSKCELYFHQNSELRNEISIITTERDELREKMAQWEALAREAVEEFDDARGYATSDYFKTEEWGYSEISARFQARLAALSDDQDGRGNE